MTVTAKMRAFLAYTIAHDGGTFTPALDVARFLEGYMVSVEGCGFILKANEKPKTEQLRALTEKAQELGGYVGTWIDAGRAHYDISLHLSTLAEATEAGRLNNQLAIYDLATQKSIAI